MATDRSAAPVDDLTHYMQNVPMDTRGLVRRYRDALADSFEKLAAFGYDADVKEIADRYGFVYIEPKPEVRLSQSVPPDQRIFDEHTR